MSRPPCENCNCARRNIYCANCGEGIETRSGNWTHTTGPQAMKHRCALNPYGKYNATPEVNDDE